MTITAAADGSALGNPGPNGWAWYIDDDRWAAGGSAHGTNNQGELRAVLELLLATAEADEPLIIECDSRYVIDSVTKWMPGWKRRGWRKADGAPVLNRDLLEGIDEALVGREVRFEWVKGHAGHPLNEAADERANAAARAYQQKQEPRRGPGFSREEQIDDAPPAGEEGTPEKPAPEKPTPESPAHPDASRGSALSAPARWTDAAAPLWAEADDLLAGLDGTTSELGPVELTIALSPAEHARLRDRADAQSIALDEALRRLI